MTWYRIQEKDSKLRYIDGDKLLVTNKPEVIWNMWYGYETVDVYEVTGNVIENRTETHEDDKGNEMVIQAPVIRVVEVRKVATWKLK